ncbi:MAG: zf-TFIIB domain-containing protein, partial [Candidatus Eremiobacterota bacterium]
MEERVAPHVVEAHAAPGPQCPHDASPLDQVQVLGRSVQSCPTCGGTWVSPDDLGSMGVRMDSVRVDSTRTTGRRCPGCGRELHLATLPGRGGPGPPAPGLELEACPSCSGLWFGKGA